jgi:hypothetical protein
VHADPRPGIGSALEAAHDLSSWFVDGPPGRPYVR